jgi:hypothetical protein
LFDSTVNKQTDVKYLYKGRTKPEETILVVEKELNIDSDIFLFTDYLIDLSGNITTKDFKKIIVSDRSDTSAVKVVTTEPNQNGVIDFSSPHIKIFFDDAFNKDGINAAIIFEDTLRNPVPFKIDLYDDATLIVTPSVELKHEKDYRIKINLNNFIDASGNKIDSVFILTFKTISGLDFTGLSGKLISADTTSIDFSSKPILVLEKSEDENIFHKENITSEDFEFTRVEPGKYILWCFMDEDENGEFNFGYPFPFEHSEKFFFYPDTLNLRPRWEVTDLQFRLK